MGQALCGWLKLVLQEVQPWMSSLDIQAGELWEKEVHDHLEQAQYAIVCVTAKNYQRPWLNYETGATGVLRGKTCPYLLRAEFNLLGATPLSRYMAHRTRDTFITWCRCRRAEGRGGEDHAQRGRRRRSTYHPPRLHASLPRLFWWAKSTCPSRRSGYFRRWVLCLRLCLLRKVSCF